MATAKKLKSPVPVTPSRTTGKKKLRENLEKILESGDKESIKVLREYAKLILRSLKRKEGVRANSELA